MKEIIKEIGSVYGSKAVWNRFDELIGQLNPSKIFILTDKNTKTHCLPYFQEKIDIPELKILTMDAGESFKNITTCLSIWESLSSQGADRNSVLINLGGGVVTDLGGFVASTYQRGIKFINIPTSLLAMVDASVGGKNGVDLGVVKNQIGVIQNPNAVFIDPGFLNTLPNSEIKSGQAEMIKHGFIHSEKYLSESFLFNTNNGNKAASQIWESIEIKNHIVTLDPTEKNLRKTLNYGHTLGHAIESYCMQSTTKKSLLHGEAIAVGLILATFLSSELLDFPKDKLHKYSAQILSLFPKIPFSEKDIKVIIDLLRFDKKNSHGKVLFVLLNKIGEYRIDCVVSENLIYDAFKFYELCSAD